MMSAKRTDGDIVGVATWQPSNVFNLHRNRYGPYTSAGLLRQSVHSFEREHSNDVLSYNGRNKQNSFFSTYWVYLFSSAWDKLR